MSYVNYKPPKRGDDDNVDEEKRRDREDEKPPVDVGIDTDGSGLSVAIRLPGVPNLGIDTKDGTLTILPF